MEVSITIVPSSKGRDMAQIDGNLYYVEKVGPDGFTTYYKCIHLFLVSDCPGKDRLIVDGTFKMCPSLFYQIYTIHGMFMDEIVPFVYGYLPSKKETCYTKMFECLGRAGEPKHNRGF